MKSGAHRTVSRPHDIFNLNLPAELVVLIRQTGTVRKSEEKGWWRQWALCTPDVRVVVSLEVCLTMRHAVDDEKFYKGKLESTTNQRRF